MDKKVITTIVIVTVLILFGAVFFLSGTTSSSQITASQNAKAAADVTNFDWGNIPYNGGNVTKKFSIKNTGTDTLKLTNIKTSCHCTKAAVSINGVESPYFGMDNTSSWVGDVSPGKQAQLIVVYDPAFHGPSGVGPVNRFVSVETNDANNLKLTFSLTGTVIK